MPLVADLLPVKVVYPDGHVEHRKSRAFLMTDRVVLYCDGSSEPSVWPIVGVVEAPAIRTRMAYSVPVDGGTLLLTQQGCGGCSPLRRLTPPQ